MHLINEKCSKLKSIGKKHIPTYSSDGRVNCSCGMNLISKHIYNLHIEHHAPNLPPFDTTGWPSIQFQTIPYLNKVQRAVIGKGTAFALFATIYLEENFDDKLVREVVSKFGSEHFNSQVSAVAPDARLVSVIAVENKLWRKWDPNPPAYLKSFTEKRHKKTNELLFPAGGGDLYIMAKSDRVDICYELVKKVVYALGDSVSHTKQTLGFRYLGGKMFGYDYAKDLTGFIDGTRNPDHLLRAIVDEVIILPDDEKEPAHVGGSYLYTGRFVHDLKKFFKMPDEDKSHIIGRVYGKESPHKGYDTRPENPRHEGAHHAAHVFRGFGAMYRHAYPYRYEQEEGLFFTAYSRSLEELDSAISRMAGHFEEDGSTDNLLSISRNVTSNYYYVPSLDELNSLTTIRVIPIADPKEVKEKKNQK